MDKITKVAGEKLENVVKIRIARLAKKAMYKKLGMPIDSASIELAFYELEDKLNEAYESSNDTEAIVVQERMKQKIDEVFAVARMVLAKEGIESDFSHRSFGYIDETEVADFTGIVCRFLDAYVHPAQCEPVEE